MEVAQTIKQEKVDCFAKEPNVNFKTNILDSMEIKLKPIKIEPCLNVVHEPNILDQKLNLLEEAEPTGNNDKSMINYSLNEISNPKGLEIKLEESEELGKIKKTEDIVDIKWAIENKELQIKGEINMEDEEQGLNEISKPKGLEIKLEESEELGKIKKTEDIVDIKWAIENKELQIKDEINMEDEEQGPKMDRKSRILFNAFKKYDEDIMNRLQIPLYESTKGTTSYDREVIFAKKNAFINEFENTVGISKGQTTPCAIVQIEQISTTKKVHATRHSVEKIKNIFSDIDRDNPKFIEKISSTVDESDLGEDNDSSDEYVPATEVEYESDSECLELNELECRETKEPFLTKKVTRRVVTNVNNQIPKENNDLNLQHPDPSDQNALTLKKEPAQKSKKKRVWNKRDHCLYCYNDVTKFSRHVVKHHQCEIKVQKILALKVGDKKRKYLFNKLRNEGNFLKSSSEEKVVPIRKPVLGDQPTQLTYLPCKYCKGFYKKRALYRHVKNCAHNEKNNTGRTFAQAEGQSLLSSYRSNDLLRKEVFPKMRADNTSFVAKTDPIICAVAARYLKSHKEKQFLLVASRKMRQLALLLIEIKKQKKVKTLLECLDPVNFDIIVECTKVIARLDPETETYGAPSLAANMGTQLKECIDVAYNIFLKKFQTETESMKKLKSLKDLISNEWQYEVSTMANQNLSQKKWNKPSLVTLAEDLTLLKSYLLSQSEKNRNALDINSNDEKAFKTLQEICYIELLLLNRRRPGELQRITIHTYTSNINNHNLSEFDNCISESENFLIKSFKRLVIKGKRGRGVSVLFTEEMIKSTEMLLKNRRHFIPQNNIYLFANPKSSSSISGTKVMYKHVRLAGVKNATALTSTRLRKHLATMSQVINLSEQDLEQLATFMGHTSDIHKTYYRLPNDVYQMAKVSKLLLLNERGEASKFKGKRLDEIEIDLDPIDEDLSEDEEGEICDRLKDNEKVTVKPTQKKRRILEPWTETQRKVASLYFKDHLKKKIPPKKNECLMLKYENPDIFFNKSWEKIKIYIVNKYKKMG